MFEPGDLLKVPTAARTRPLQRSQHPGRSDSDSGSELPVVVVDAILHSRLLDAARPHQPQLGGAATGAAKYSPNDDDAFIVKRASELRTWLNHKLTASLYTRRAFDSP